MNKAGGVRTLALLSVSSIGLRAGQMQVFPPFILTESSKEARRVSLPDLCVELLQFDCSGGLKLRVLDLKALDPNSLTSNRGAVR